MTALAMAQMHTARWAPPLKSSGSASGGGDEAVSSFSDMTLWGQITNESVKNDECDV